MNNLNSHFTPHLSHFEMPQEQIIKLGSFSPCIEGDLEWSLPRSAHTYALQCRTPKAARSTGGEKRARETHFYLFFLNTNIATGGPRYYIRERERVRERESFRPRRVRLIPSTSLE